MMDEEQRAFDPAVPEGAPDASSAPGDAQVPPAGGEPQPDPAQVEAPQPKAPPRGAGRGKKKGKPKRGSFLRELPILVVIALVLALIIKTYAFQAYFIPSGSMENTLEIGDKVLVNKIVYHLRSIHRGDIVVFNGQGSWNPGPAPQTPNPFDRLYHAVIGLFGAAPGQTDYIKRVIGVPGDHVVCCNAKGQITVNGIALSEPTYLYPGNTPSQTPFNITVPSGRLWVMGDHRAVSDDSRDHTGYPGGGTIPENMVVGRAFWIVWPPSRWTVLNIPATFEQPALNASKGSSALAAGQSGGAGSLSIPAVPAGSSLPLAAGFIGAVPLTWGQRRLRRRLHRRR
ncbi:MAG TPA: signal peptidase I [Streptosporangiaceae bacterium]|jgi:signal peptidase I|nr:signal peptidase I [Streptosporangiaceae bacterium]